MYMKIKQKYPRRDVTKSQKQGYQWPPQKGMCLPNFFNPLLMSSVVFEQKCEPFLFKTLLAVESCVFYILLD